MSVRNLACLALLALLVLPVTSSELNPAEKILQAYGPTLVQVRYVLRLKVDERAVSHFGVDQEIPGDITGLMIDPQGLVVCSNAELSNYTGLMNRYMGIDSTPSAVPTQIEVKVDGRDEAHPARLLAIDEDLDLAWIRIEDPGAGFAYLDLRTSTSPRVGEAFYLLRRADDAFGRVPMLLTGQVGGITQTPRRLYLPAAPLGHAFGLPVWTSEGELVGVTTLQLPPPDDTETTTNTLAMMSQTARLRDQATAVVLPARVVAQATENARRLAERAADPKAETSRRTP